MYSVMGVAKMRKASKGALQNLPVGLSPVKPPGSWASLTELLSAP
jgi:hypothetical protein